MFINMEVISVRGCAFGLIFHWSIISSITRASDSDADDVWVQHGTPEYLQALVNSDTKFWNVNPNYNQLDDATVQDSIGILGNYRMSLPEQGPNTFLPVSQQDIGDRCVKVPRCDEMAKYRSLNGSCNNVIFAMWGMAGSPLVRLVRANYKDAVQSYPMLYDLPHKDYYNITIKEGVWEEISGNLNESGVNEPRLSVTGQPLPTPGELRPFFLDKDVPDEVNVVNVMEWGQVISHDTSHIINQKSDKGTGLMCCRRGRPRTDPTSQPKPCMHIDIPKDDHFYSQFNLTCLNFVRSVTTSNLGCNLSPEQQVATVTHFIDASFVYGSFDEVGTSLRTFSGGLLKTQVTPDNRHFPPNSETARQECDNHSPNDACYKTGDDRVNLNPGIAVHQIIFLREHNRLCEELQALNPHWDDETLYQEARRIVIAITQRITYRHFLPIILGTKFLRKINLLDGDEDQDLSITDYDIFLNPSTVNGFTTAAYRFFHSMIPGTMSLVSEEFKEEEVPKLEDFFFKPNIVQLAGNLDKFLRGLAFQAAQTMDRFFSISLTQLLFKSKRSFGTDLVSIDIQRGRDHGLASYNEYRVACGLPKAKDFHDFSDVMTKEAIDKLKSKYASPDDVDFYVGGLLETLVPHTLLGPTFQCITGEQFKRWRNGDRFYYEFGGFPGSFTKSQVIEIRKVTLATIFCRNGDNITKIQPDVFLHQSTENRVIPCSRIPKMDLEPWKEASF